MMRADKNIAKYISLAEDIVDVTSQFLDLNSEFLNCTSLMSFQWKCINIAVVVLPVKSYHLGYDSWSYGK